MASAVMAILMVGVLQIFSISLVTNQGAAARTDLTFRAQQVMENLRMIQYFARHTNEKPAQDAGVALTKNPVTKVATVNPMASTGIPNDPADAHYAFWHAAGIVGDTTDPYRISYTIQDLTGTAGAPAWAGNFYLVTVIASAVDAPGGASGVTGVTATNKAQGKWYLGEASKMKRVEYVGQLLH